MLVYILSAFFVSGVFGYIFMTLNKHTEIIKILRNEIDFLNKRILEIEENANLNIKLLESQIEVEIEKLKQEEKDIQKPIKYDLYRDVKTGLLKSNKQYF